MNLKEAKILNIKSMILELGKIYQRMGDSDLRKDFKRFLFFIQSNKADFKLVLEFVIKRIEMYGKSKNTIDGLDNKGIINFWKKIKELILGTYLKNKDIDRSIDGR